MQEQDNNCTRISCELINTTGNNQDFLQKDPHLKKSIFSSMILEVNKNPSCGSHYNCWEPQSSSRSTQRKGDVDSLPVPDNHVPWVYIWGSYKEEREVWAKCLTAYRKKFIFSILKCMQPKDWAILWTYMRMPQYISVKTCAAVTPRSWYHSAHSYTIFSQSRTIMLKVSAC